MPGLTFTVSSLQISSNSAGGGASPLDWTKVQTGGVAILDANGATHTIAMTADTPLVISGDASIDVAGLLAGSTHFVISQSTVDVPSVGETGANLLTIALSNVHLAVGTTSIGAQIGGGSLTIGLLVAASGPKRWFGLSSSSLSASLVLPGVTATISNLNIQVNEASGAGATPLDWSTVPGNQLGSLSGDQLSADGDLSNLSIFGILSGSAHVSFARQTVDVQLSGGTIVSGATLVSFSLEPRRRRDAPGRRAGVRADDHEREAAHRRDRACGFDRRAALDRRAGHRPRRDPRRSRGSPRRSPPSTSRSTTPPAARRRSTGRPRSAATTPARSTFTPAPVEVATGGGSTTPVTLTNAILSLSGHLTLSVGSFLSLEADFVLNRSGISLDLNGDGTADLTAATLLTLGLSNVTGSLGVSGGPSIQLNGGSFALASIATTDGSSATWTAIEGTVTSASLTGIPGLTLNASSLTLKVNTASGTYGASVSAARARTGRRRSTSTRTGTSARRPTSSSSAARRST